MPTVDFEVARLPSLKYPRRNQADEDERKEEEQLDRRYVTFRLRFRAAEQKNTFLTSG